MCVHRLLSSFGAGGCVLLAEKRLRQSFMTAAAFLFDIKPYPLRHISENGSLINCRFQKDFGCRCLKAHRHPKRNPFFLP